MSRYRHIEAIPAEPAQWEVELRGADAIASSLVEHGEEALFYRELATLREDVGLPETLAQLEWRGVRRPEFEELCAELGFSENIHPHEWSTG